MSRLLQIVRSIPDLSGYAIELRCNSNSFHEFDHISGHIIKTEDSLGELIFIYQGYFRYAYHAYNFATVQETLCFLVYKAIPSFHHADIFATAHQKMRHPFWSELVREIESLYLAACVLT